MLLWVAIIVVVLWLLGLLGHIGGGLINLLLVVALVLFIASILSGRREV